MSSTGAARWSAAFVEVSFSGVRTLDRRIPSNADALEMGRVVH
jgi:hypothetical protein